MLKKIFTLHFVLKKTGRLSISFVQYILYAVSSQGPECLYWFKVLVEVLLVRVIDSLNRLDRLSLSCVMLREFLSEDRQRARITETVIDRHKEQDALWFCICYEVNAMYQISSHASGITSFLQVIQVQSVFFHFIPSVVCCDLHLTTSSVPLQKQIPLTDCVMVKHKGYQLSAQKSEASLEIFWMIFI